jgi:hypothetical protein
MKTKNWNELIGTKVGDSIIIAISSRIKDRSKWILVNKRCKHDIWRRVITCSFKSKKIYCSECIRIKNEKSTKFLTFIRHDKLYNNKTYNFYKCKCGKQKSIDAYNVRYGQIISCGCIGRSLKRKSGKNLVGMEFNGCKVMKRVPVDKGLSKYLCRCFCKKKFIATSKQINQGHKSCGCLKYRSRKLSMKEAKEIRSLYKIGYTETQLAKLFEASVNSISDIVDLKSYL